MIAALHARVTPKQLQEVGPTRIQLEQIICAAQSAPDHGRLKPWRFFVIEGEARHKLGRLMASALAQRSPDSTSDELAKEAAKPLRAPVIVVIACKVQPSLKVSALEQVMAVAAAAQNFQVAAHSLGYGCQWKTGPAAQDPAIKQAFDLAEADILIGFMYVGTITQPGPTRDGSLDTSRVSYWSSVL